MNFDPSTPIGRGIAFYHRLRGTRQETHADPSGDGEGVGTDRSPGTASRAGGGDSFTAAIPGTTTNGQNPFLMQRHEFHNRFYDLVRAKRNWQLMAFTSMALAFLSSAAFIIMASSSRVTPYVVEVNDLGVARAFGRAEQTTMKNEDRIVTAELSEFITNTRRVVADPDAQKETILEAYAYADKSARSFLNNYYSQAENDPRVLAEKIRRTIHIESILKIPDSDSYRVRWKERERGLNSSSVLVTSWEAILSVDIIPPIDEETLLVNPLGVYVYDINWGRVNQQHQ